MEVLEMRDVGNHLMRMVDDGIGRCEMKGIDVETVSSLLGPEDAGDFNRILTPPPAPEARLLLFLA
jgi:hypothetical protein